MKSPLPYFRNFPDNFRSDTLNAIKDALHKNKNVQLIGVKGSGKSITLRAIRTDPRFTADYDIYLIDLHLLSGFTVTELSKLIEQEIGGDLKQVFKPGRKVLFLVDSFDYLYKKLPESITVFKGMEDKYRDFVAFLFALEIPISDQVFFGKIVDLSRLSGSDLEWFWKGIGGVEKFKQKIFDASGGVMALIKRLNEIAEAGDLDAALENPRAFPHLNYQLELIKEWGSANNNVKNIPIFDIFINGSGNTDLTKLEFKAFEFLKNNPAQIVEREDLINAIWGESATKGVADHALDQLMHRLKGKVGKKYNIVTVRGRGYKLSAG